MGVYMCFLVDVGICVSVYGYVYMCICIFVYGYMDRVSWYMSGCVRWYALFKCTCMNVYVNVYMFEAERTCVYTYISVYGTLCVFMYIEEWKRRRWEDVRSVYFRDIFFSQTNNHTYVLQKSPRFYWYKPHQSLPSEKTPLTTSGRKRKGSR